LLLKLSAPGLRPLSETSPGPFVGRICTRPDASLAARSHDIFLSSESPNELPEGFRAYLLRTPGDPGGKRDVYLLGSEHGYLGDEDVVRLEPARGSITALYRRSSSSNAFLVTERCDNYCLMCSQPPKEKDDSWLLEELRDVIPLVSPDTSAVGITGGEPALVGKRLVDLVGMLKLHLPRTAVHVLSNGRRFSDLAFARDLASVQHPDLMVGIPLYSALPESHDYVVQANGAFDETVRGILNLKRAGVRVELRFVIHAVSYKDLPAFATFVARNLLFVDHVALMGLELMGFAKANLEMLWIDPLDYHSELFAAVDTLRRAGVPTSIYNHQLCVLPAALHAFARRSISDWKNRQFEECEQCSLRESCGGFFASATLRRSRGIAPIRG
jgi:His-Xaa-Ser system radical SAM maturase HxsC